MKQPIEFFLQNGESILVEADVTEPEGGITPAARPGEIITEVDRNFEAALEKIKPAAEAIMKKLHGLSDSPAKIQVEFGVKLSADVGAIIASTGAEANFKITLVWNRQKSQ